MDSPSLQCLANAETLKTRCLPSSKTAKGTFLVPLLPNHGTHISDISAPANVSCGAWKRAKMANSTRSEDGNPLVKTTITCSVKRDSLQLAVGMANLDYGLMLSWNVEIATLSRHSGMSHCRSLRISSACHLSFGVSSLKNKSLPISAPTFC